MTRALVSLAFLVRSGGARAHFSSQHRSFWRLERLIFVALAPSVRSPRNIGRSYDFSTSELVCDDAKSMKNHSASAFDGARCSKRARTLLWGGLGASPGQLGDAFGRLWAVLGSPLIHSADLRTVGQRHPECLELMLNEGERQQRSTFDSLAAAAFAVLLSESPAAALQRSWL